ncbi:MAG: hypothetical protein LC799_21855 [Actinobacteria bacterium]|nr:hypothetical protein [Actinomycetota bacterium]
MPADDSCFVGAATVTSTHLASPKPVRIVVSATRLDARSAGASRGDHQASCNTSWTLPVALLGRPRLRPMPRSSRRDRRRRPRRVEADLASGAISCPGCGGPLRARGATLGPAGFET